MQVMRHDVALALGKSGPNVDVMCTDKEFGGRFMPFAKVRNMSTKKVIATLHRPHRTQLTYNKLTHLSVRHDYSRLGSCVSRQISR